MTLPPASHPCWKILQSLISVLGMAILVSHGAEGGHTAGLDAEDISGAVGLAAGANVIRQLLKG